MKKFFIIALCFLLLATPVSAQEETKIAMEDLKLPFSALHLEEDELYPYKTFKEENNVIDTIYKADTFKLLGVINWEDYRWTWYSERVLPGGGLDIPGRQADENGYICDEDNRICLASSTLKKGTIITTPFGKEGKVYDCGCAIGTIDVYVNW